MPVSRYRRQVVRRDCQGTHLLEELSQAAGTVEQKLSVEKAKLFSIERIAMNEQNFRWMFNENPMAVDKLSEGIRKFAEDAKTLEALILARY